MNQRMILRLALVLTCGLFATSVTPAQAADLIPLPPPGQPVASSISSTGATLTWNRPDGPVFRYSMKQLVNGEWVGYASMPSNTFTLAGLTPNTTYTFAVYAAALAGSGYSTSPLSQPVTFTTLGSDLWTCSIQITVWTGFYLVNGTLTWHGPAPSPGWTVTFSIPGNLTVNQAWNGTFTQSGTQGSIAGNQWGGAPPPGTQIGFGFLGQYSGTFIPPGSFRVNGIPCRVS